MNKKLLLIVAISVGLMPLYGYVGLKKIHYPEPPGEVAVEGDTLYLDNAPYAELRYFQGGKFEESSGVAIYYYPYDREEWIFPKEGWGYYVIEEKKRYGSVAEIEQLEREAKQKGYMICWEEMKRDIFNPDKIIHTRGDREFVKAKKMPGTAVYNVHFSEDGKYVLYELITGEKESGLKRYRVKYGECFDRNLREVRKNTYKAHWTEQDITFMLLKREKMRRRIARNKIGGEEVLPEKIGRKMREVLLQKLKKDPRE